MRSNPRILIADDDDTFRAMLMMLFRQTRHQFHLTEVRNGQEAYTHYQQYGADLILTDDQMPIMSGTELINTLRADGHTTPIVMLSGRQAMRDAVAHDVYTVFMMKPVLIPELLATVDQLLAG